MNAERCLFAGEALGLVYAALEKAVNYAQEWVVFGRPIGQNQGIQHPLATSYMSLEAAKLATYRAARLYHDPDMNSQTVGVAANSAKYLAAEAAFTACVRAVLMHGYMGYAQEYDVERYLRKWFVPCIALVNRVCSFSIYRGSSAANIFQEMILNYVGKRVLKLP